jgi:hypothetical protein
MAKLEDDTKNGEATLGADPAIIEPLKQYMGLVNHVDATNHN